MDYKEKVIALLNSEELSKEQKEKLEAIFPELKEDKDEKIRKELIENFKWFCGDFPETTKWGKDDNLLVKDIIIWLEKQGKQPTDKVEPKFKVGDWVVNNHDGSVGQIKKIVSGELENAYTHTSYGYDHTNGYFHQEFENAYHLWTIQDAKDGDVLVASDGSIFLFAGVDDCACEYYVALTTDNYLKINKEVKGGYWETSRAVYPATKEQRDLFFSKMKKAGWEWDAEKKELKKTYKTT